MTDMVTTCNVNSATLGLLRATIMYNNTIDSIRYGFTLRMPEPLRCKLIAMGIENQCIIQKACNLSAQLYGKQFDNWDYEYTAAIYREVVDYCRKYPCAKEFALKTVRDYRDWNCITAKEYDSLMYTIDYEYNKLEQASKEEETNMKYTVLKGTNIHRAFIIQPDGTRKCVALFGIVRELAEKNIIFLDGKPVTDKWIVLFSGETNSTPGFDTKEQCKACIERKYNEQ